MGKGQAQAESEQKSASAIAEEEEGAAKAAKHSADEAKAEEVGTVKTDIDKRKKEQDVKQESLPNKTQKKDPGGDLFHLYIHKARNLENKDILGKSDPHVHVRFGSKEARSATVDNALNPEWQFHTEFVTDDTSPSSVEIKIFDDDFGKSDPLGKLTLDLEGFKKGEVIQQEWLSLDEAVSGDVQVSQLSKELPDVQLKSENHKKENKEKPKKEVIVGVTSIAKEDVTAVEAA